LLALVLVGVRILPLHVVDLRLWTYELLRRTMARYAPFHLERVLLEYGRHVVDLSVTGRTANALCNVNTVVKIGEFRQVVDAFPFDRLVVAKARPHWLEIRAVVPYLAVAIHARLRRRHA